MSELFQELARELQHKERLRYELRKQEKELRRQRKKLERDLQRQLAEVNDAVASREDDDPKPSVFSKLNFNHWLIIYRISLAHFIMSLCWLLISK